MDEKTCPFAIDLGHWAAFQIIQHFVINCTYQLSWTTCLSDCFLSPSFSKYLKEFLLLWMRSQLLPQTESSLHTIHFSSYDFVQATSLSTSFLCSKESQYFLFCKTHKCVRRRKAIYRKKIILKEVKAVWTLNYHYYENPVGSMIFYVI